jgi:hypothetical protein
MREVVEITKIPHEPSPFLLYNNTANYAALSLSSTA